MSTEGNECLMRVKITRDGEPSGEPEVVLPFPGDVIESFSIARDGTAVFSVDPPVGRTSTPSTIDAGGESPEPRQLTFDDVAQHATPTTAPAAASPFEQEGAGRPSPRG